MFIWYDDIGVKAKAGRLEKQTNFAFLYSTVGYSILCTKNKLDHESSYSGPISSRKKEAEGNK